MHRRLIFLSLLLFFSPLALFAQNPLRFDDQIAVFEQEDLADPSPTGALLFVGSSSIRMWKDVRQAIPGFVGVNRGFGGSHFSDAIYWFEELFVPHRPAAIFLYEGDNDIASGKSKDEILRDAETLVAMIRTIHPEVPIGFISPKPSVARWNLKAQYLETNAALKAYAESEDGLFYVDVWYPALDAEGKPRPETFIEDMLHMNAKGYAIWQEQVAQALEAMGLK